MSNPFQFQRPLLPAEMIGREQELQYLLDALDSATMVRLDAPRRYGKTTLMERAISELDKQGDIGILVDLKGVMTLADITGRIAKAYSNLTNSAINSIKKELQNIEVEFGLSILGGKVKIKRPAPNQVVSNEQALFALLDIPNRLAAQGERRVLVCFDEFQDVLQVPEADSKMRSQMQHHDRFVSYVFAGSQPRLMDQLFSTNRSSGFWSQADPLPLLPLPSIKVIEYVTSRFEDAGKNIDDVIVPLASTAQGHPYGVMLLANKLWHVMGKQTTATASHWGKALEATRVQVSPALDAQWAALTPEDRRLLRAVIVGNGHPSRQIALEETGLKAGSIQSGILRLIGDCFLRKVGKGVYQFVDPFMELYVEDLAQ